MKKAIFFIVFGIFLISQNTNGQTITIDPTIQYQTMSGFGQFGGKTVWWNGGPFHDDTWLTQVVDDLGATIHRDEYYPDGGGLYPENKDDQDADWEKQKPMLIALKNKAIASGEPMKFIVTLWTPPRQWKSNGSHKNGGFVKDRFYDEFAEYCVKIVKDYKDIGIDLYALSLQNEPSFETFYNSGVYQPYQLSAMMKVVGEKFEEENINTYIFGPEDMGSSAANDGWFKAILDDAEIRDHIDIWAVHSYLDGVSADGGSALGWTNLYNRCNNYKKPLWMTETSGYDDLFPGGALDVANSMYLALESGNVSGWVFWIGTLMKDGSPQKKYYSAKQFYRYIRPGAVHIESSSSDPSVLVTSYKHSEEGRITSVLINNSSSEKTVSLDFINSTAPTDFTVYQTTSTKNCENMGTVSNNLFTLPAESITTLVHESSNTSPQIDDLPKEIVILNSSGTQTISIEGISNSDAGQTISIQAQSSNTNIVPTPSINYTSPNNTATLTFTPNPSNFGATKLTIEVSNNGTSNGDLNLARREIEIKVLPFINKAPTLDSIEDITLYLEDGGAILYFEGITDGNDGSQTITVNAESFERQVLDADAYLVDGKIELYLAPYYVVDCPVTLTIKDDGGIDLGGKDELVFEFVVKTLAGSNPYPTNITSNARQLNIYPNPANSNLLVNVPSCQKGYLNIYSLSGSKIKELATNGENLLTIDIKSLQSGFYIISFEDNEIKYQSSFVKE